MSLLLPLSLKKRVESSAQTRTMNGSRLPAPSLPLPGFFVHLAGLWHRPDTTPHPPGSDSQIKDLPSALAACTLGNTQPSAGLKPCLHYWFSALESISYEGPSALGEQWSFKPLQRWCCVIPKDMLKVCDMNRSLLCIVVSLWDDS